MMDVREAFLPFAIKSRKFGLTAMVVFGQHSPQLVEIRSTLTRPSSMNDHKALRGADLFCKVAFLQPSKAMLHQAIA